MTPLQRFATLLANSKPSIETAFGTSSTIDPLIRKLRQHAKAGTENTVPDDLMAAAARKFWTTRKLESLRDARLVSFGLSLPVHTDGRCLLDDRERFLALLDTTTGVGQWFDRPRWYRRCYQGLVRSYFSYDGKAAPATDAGRRNWRDLRDYLNVNLPHIVETGSNPDWVDTATSNAAIFSEAPCEPYADAVLSGDSLGIERLCSHLGISKASWFLRDLILAQVRAATSRDDREFTSHLPKLLELLGNHLTLRDIGMALVLDRYASMNHAPPNLMLRDKAVEWWGNPWLPSNESRWGGVRRETREIVSDWLKREFVEAFFEKLAKDGVGDRRRANFWLRYVKAMTNVQFALGATAQSSLDRDYVVLRKKMKGLYTTILDGPADNNAFVMTLGNLVAVEFGSGGNALYVYDVERSLPFDASLPVRTAKNARNSLKNDQRFLWLLHKDNIHGWTQWEEMFEATLLREFSIRPDREAVPSAPIQRGHRPAAGVDQRSLLYPLTPGRQQPEYRTGVQDELVQHQPYSKAALERLARTHGLKVDDLSARNGNVWVLYQGNEFEVTSALSSWGFKYKIDKGWWLKP